MAWHSHSDVLSVTTACGWHNFEWIIVISRPSSGVATGLSHQWTYYQEIMIPPYKIMLSLLCTIKKLGVHCGSKSLGLHWDFCLQIRGYKVELTSCTLYTYVLVSTNSAFFFWHILQYHYWSTPAQRQRDAGIPVETTWVWTHFRVAQRQLIIWIVTHSYSIVKKHLQGWA